MQLHELHPIHRPKRKKRVGRGGKRGTYSGRGMKGQKSRAGRKLVPSVRGLIKRYPKLRGYRFKAKKELAIVKIGDLEKKFKPTVDADQKEKITPKTLLKKGLIRRIKGRIPRVKILGEGEITRPLVIEGCLFSKRAKENIEKAGGTIKK